MLKKILIALALLAAIASAALWHSWGERYEITLSEEQLLSKLNEKFPFEKNFLFLVTLRFEHPRLELEEGSDRIRFGCDLSVNLPVDPGGDAHTGPIQGTATLSGKIRYSATDGSFFIDDPIVDQLLLNGVPEKWMKKIRSSADKAANEFVKRAPVYRLKETDVKQAAARLVLQGVAVHERKLFLTLGVG